MSFSRKSLILLLSICAAPGADKDKVKFAPGPASSYPARQTQEKVTIAAAPYDTAELARTAFGKLNPYEYGVLPVLVIVQNDSAKTISLESMKVAYVAGGGSRVEATPAGEVRYIRAGRRPRLGQSPLPGGAPRVSLAKNPLEAAEIEGRAFAARMLPPGENAYGFFYFQYFQTGTRGGASLYVTGLREAAGGRELFYFEIPLARP